MHARHIIGPKKRHHTISLMDIKNDSGPFLSARAPCTTQPPKDTRQKVAAPIVFWCAVNEEQKTSDDSKKIKKTHGFARSESCGCGLNIMLCSSAARPPDSALNRALPNAEWCWPRPRSIGTPEGSVQTTSTSVKTRENNCKRESTRIPWPRKTLASKRASKKSRPQSCR